MIYCKLLMDSKSAFFILGEWLSYKRRGFRGYHFRDCNFGEGLERVGRGGGGNARKIIKHRECEMCLLVRLNWKRARCCSSRCANLCYSCLKIDKRVRDLGFGETGR